MKQFVWILTMAVLVTGLASAPAAADNYVIEAQGALPQNLAGLVAAAGGELLRTHGEIGIAAARSDDPSFAEKLVASSPALARCTRDAEVRWAPEMAVATVVAAPADAVPALDPTAAKFFACQWHLQQIDAPGAWAQGQFGAPGVKVAVLDTGIDPFHIDLQGRVDTANSVSMLTPGSSPCGSFDEQEIFDLGFHGTFVSSLITSNGIGTAGVAPDATLVGVKVLNCGGDGTFEDVIAGILYAASLPDVEVINMSLGGYAPRNLPGLAQLVSALTKAVNFANRAGKLVVSAAGNDGADLDHDGSFEFVPAQSGAGISVYATDIADGLASYSNHGVSGTWVGAGGGDFPNPAAPLPGCAVSPAFQSLILAACSSFVCGGDNFYALAAGTSFATPLVSGVAALLEGQAGGALTAGQVKTILTNSADDLGAPGVDNTFSHGRINAARAVVP